MIITFCSFQSWQNKINFLDLIQFKCDENSRKGPNIRKLTIYKIKNILSLFW